MTKLSQAKQLLDKELDQWEKDTLDMWSEMVMDGLAPIETENSSSAESVPVTKAVKPSITLLARPRASIRLKGGEGSGDFGHKGRPGQVGGSAEGGFEGRHTISVEQRQERQSNAKVSMVAGGKKTGRAESQRYTRNAATSYRPTKEAEMDGMKIVAALSEVYHNEKPGTMMYNTMKATGKEEHELDPFDLQNNIPVPGSYFEISRNLKATEKQQNIAAGIGADWGDSSWSKESARTQKYAHKFSGNEEPPTEEMKLEMDKAKPFDADEEAAVQAIYRKTQEQFKQAGIKEVTVYRGMKKIDLPGNEGITTFKQAPLSSWSFDPNIAAGFTHGFDSFIFSMKIPVSRILGTKFSGIGTDWEREVVVFEGVGDDEISYVRNRTL